MNNKELYDADQKMAQNDENGRYEAQKSQPQSQAYIPPPQPQPYEASQPQSQAYIPPSQPQPYETPQPQSQAYIPPPQNQTYQSSEPQTYQQTQPQSYQSSQTPYINPPVTNNINQNGSNQSSNYVMSPNPNALSDNYKPFQDGKNAPNKGRLTCQMILGILLLLNIVALIMNLGYTFRGIYGLLIIISNILNIIVGIWMIILTIKKQTTRNICLGIISLISLILYIFLCSLYIVNGYAVSVAALIDIIFLIIITSYNMKCKCCECCD